MRKYNWMIAGIIAVYLGMAFLALFLLQDKEQVENRQYLVEINRIMHDLQKKSTYTEPDITGMESIKAVSFLRVEEMTDAAGTAYFARKQNGMDSHMEPFIRDGRLFGWIKFDYTRVKSGKEALYITGGLILAAGIFMAAFLLYVKNKVLKPFRKMCEMPYELSRGRLDYELEENRNRFFGRFVWGINMLRDSLKASKGHALKLEKEKKLLLLSISHDIKTPLNMIKLYARALREGMYDEEEKREAASSIEAQAGEIEAFVKEIVKTSSEDILHLEVEKSDFYLKTIVDMLSAYYEPKCRLLMTKLCIGDYSDKLLQGNSDSAFEVLQNIMENAFKYGDGGRIEVSFYEEEYCRLIRIFNTGQPVTEQEMPHLFDSFFRGSNVGKKEGNGLGLYICREIMRRMDGDIFAERRKDGMNFIIVFR